MKGQGEKDGKDHWKSGRWWKKSDRGLIWKKIALENIIKIIEPNNESLYNKVVFDYGITLKEFEEWWANMSKKYNWEGVNWRIDFQTNEIILLEN